jgi:hypothetical protein
MFLPVFDQNVTNESMAQKHERIFRDYGIRIWETEVDFSKGERPPLRIEINGRPLKNLMGSSCHIYLVDHKYLIIKDSTPYRNIHAFDIEGNWLWDIEPCNYKDGKPTKYFLGICDAITDESGKRQLIVGNFPVTYRTDLATGKGTTIWEIKDDTDFRY